MRKKRSHAYHLRLKPFDEENIFYQMVHRLVRTAYHDSGSHLLRTDGNGEYWLAPMS